MIITMSRFGNYGRNGNILFQWQFLKTIAAKYDAELILPHWDGFKYFKNPPKIGTVTGEMIKEPHYRYDMEPYESLAEGGYDFLGYWQNEKYATSPIEFTDDYRDEIRDKFYLELARPTIAIGVRRTDYLTLPYHNLPINYFITALLHNFPDYENYNIIFITDDPAYCRLHFGCLKNAYFPDTKDIEAMCLMSLCDNIIMANSTFYWWAGKLGNPKRVIQPTKLFAGKLLEKYGDINFYSDAPGWTQHEACPIDISDTVFTIPVYYDHPDRKSNINTCIDQINRHFKTNISVCEQIKVGGTPRFEYTNQWCKHSVVEQQAFHRTKMLNDMAIESEASIIANWDCDIVVPPMQVWETVKAIRNGAEMVYPYDGLFHRISVKDKHKMREDIGVYANDEPNGTNSFGGAVMWSKKVFMESGMENEYFVSYGPEDVERMERAVAIGVKVTRTLGNLYHFDHFKGPDSCARNPFFKNNKKQLNDQRGMDRATLINYIHQWPWYKPYTASYYETITEDAIRSRDEVFRILGVPMDGSVSIADLGAGAGQWGVGLNNYTAYDLNVPKDAILVDDYREWDLRKQKPGLFTEKRTVVLCLEVAEHIEEQYADQLVDNICESCQDDGLIIFSAAIPYQGGTGHVNEQWQTWWEKKFVYRKYWGETYSNIQYNDRVSMWYRQNLVVYRKNYCPMGQPVTDFVLPEYYEEKMKYLKR